MGGETVSWKTVFRILAIAVVALAAAGSVFAWSGIYNVAASKDHLGVTTWLLEQVRDRSVEARAMSLEAPPLDDDGMRRLGAAHFEGGCVPCHNRPGERITAVINGMLPSPPDLAKIGTEREPEPIFWIVKHGFKYTGMPAWPSQLRDDEVWAVTAFLKTLPAPKKDYLELAGITRAGHPEKAGGMDMSASLAQCDRCHETQSLATNGDRIPRLAGQSEAYLFRSLKEYAERLRPSGVMQPVADLLTEADIRKLAAHYAALSPPASPVMADPDPQQLARGREINEHGDRSRDVPACISCHAVGKAAQFPLLSGQHAEYLMEQLCLWQRGGRDGTTHGRIMAPVATRMTDEQIIDVSLYLSTLPLAKPQDLAEAQP